MTERTFSRRLQQLIQQVEAHPNREEILRLAQEQLLDDTFVLAQQTSTCN